MEDFLDEDELAEAAKHSLQARPGYDTFASAAAERARAQVCARCNKHIYNSLVYWPTNI